MFVLGFKKTRRDRINRLLEHLVSEMRCLETTHEVPEKAVQDYLLKVTVRVVSVEARALLGMIVELDKALASMVERYGAEEASERCKEVFYAYGRLKKQLFG